MKILVTGANGLVGSALRKYSPENTIFVTREDADLRDFGATLALFERHRPTHVIHTAAEVGGIGGNMARPGEYFLDNLLINANVLEVARRADVEKVLSFLSTCIFPNNASFPLNESSLHDGPPHPSNAAYAYAKRMIDVQSRAYRAQWGCNFITAVGTNIYGPHDNFSIAEGHVLPALIHKCFIAAQEGNEFPIWGSGKALREFVLSDDIAKLALWAIAEYEEPDPIIFTSGVETSIKELVELVAGAMDFTGPIVFDASKPDGQLRKPSDTTKLRHYLPDFTFTPVPKGVRETVAWFKEAYPDVRM